MKDVEKLIERFIFFSRWFQLPVYVGLVFACVLYVLKFIKQLWYLTAGFAQMTENEIMLSVLTLIDISMVVNLLVVVFIGGYCTFIDFDDHEDKPDWLSKINASSLKIKLIISLVSISGVHLLKTFIDINNITLQNALLQIGIHLVFIFSALILAYTDKIMHSTDSSNSH